MQRVKQVLFVLLLHIQVNSYGHGGTVSSPDHTFSWASLNKQLTSTSCTYFRKLSRYFRHKTLVIIIIVVMAQPLCQ